MVRRSGTGEALLDEVLQLLFAAALPTSFAPCCSCLTCDMYKCDELPVLLLVQRWCHMRVYQMLVLYPRLASIGRTE